MKYIDTERLILREWTLDDVADLVEGLGNFETAKNLITPFPYTAQNSVEYITKHLKNTANNYAFAAELKENGKVIGGTNLSISGSENSGGIWINENYTKMGFGTEISIARAKFAFEALNLDEVQNGYLEFNNRSKMMQEKLGYKAIGKSTKFCPALNKEFVEILTRLTKTDFYKAMQNPKLKTIYDKIKILKK